MLAHGLFFPVKPNTQNYDSVQIHMPYLNILIIIMKIAQIIILEDL